MSSARIRILLRLSAPSFPKQVGHRLAAVHHKSDQRQQSDVEPESVVAESLRGKTTGNSAGDEGRDNGGKLFDNRGWLRITPVKEPGEYPIGQSAQIASGERGPEAAPVDLPVSLHLNRGR